MTKTPFLDGDRLSAVRQNTDWRRLFTALQIRKDEKKSREHDWWGWSPLKPEERTASFHMNDRGWYCHSCGRGGGPIELVQALHPALNCYEAGHWLLEHEVSHLVAATRSDIATCEKSSQDHSAIAPDSKTALSDEVALPNPPIRQDLRSRMQPDHALFAERGIPPPVLAELSAGYWERKKPRRDGKSDPLNGRLVFQVRGLEEGEDGHLRPVILTHMGRATTAEQEERDGKWWFFPGFRKSCELYNLDHAILDDEARQQVQETEHVIIVEGCFDVAKLWAAGIRNVVATFGARLLPDQIPRIKLIDEMVGVERFLIWYDRDQDGSAPHGTGAREAAQLLRQHRYQAEVFDWGHRFPSPRRGEIPIPATITDPAELSVEQLQWLRQKGWV